MKNMRILRIIGSVDPRGGGPVENARIMSRVLGTAGDETTFITLDPIDAPFLNDVDFPVIATGPNPGKFGHSAAFQSALKAQVAKHDVAIVHGLWNYATARCASTLRSAHLPYVAFTHGMLDPWFAQQNPLKNIAKQAYWGLYQGRVLAQAHRVLFTCEEEMRLANRAFKGHHYTPKVVSYCAQSQAPLQSDPKDAMRSKIPMLGDRPYLLFLSRIHPKKACDILIEAFATIAKIAPNIDLVIAGPDERNWRIALDKRARALGISERIHWPGMLTGAAKRQAFAQAEAFVLPSHQENFGIVVAEALSAGCPVLISNKVNIWREIIASNAGMVCEDTVESTTQMLQNFLALSPVARAKIANASKPCYAKNFSVDAAAIDLRRALCHAIEDSDIAKRKANNA